MANPAIGSVSRRAQVFLHPIVRGFTPGTGVVVARTIIDRTGSQVLKPVPDRRPCALRAAASEI
jgi:hypothetical protein